MTSLPSAVNQFACGELFVRFLAPPHNIIIISRIWEIAHEIDQPGAFADEKSRGIELRRIGSWRSALPVRRSEAVTCCLHTTQSIRPSWFEIARKKAGGGTACCSCVQKPPRNRPTQVR